MSKSLIIAEKPSVATDLARALGGFKKVDDYFENDRYIISSAIGHLVELCLPGELDVKRGKWSFANLPIIPDEFDLKPVLLGKQADFIDQGAEEFCRFTASGLRIE